MYGCIFSAVLGIVGTIVFLKIETRASIASGIIGMVMALLEIIDYICIHSGAFITKKFDDYVKALPLDEQRRIEEQSKNNSIKCFLAEKKAVGNRKG